MPTNFHTYIFLGKQKEDHQHSSQQPCFCLHPKPLQIISASPVSTTPLTSIHSLPFQLINPQGLLILSSLHRSPDTPCFLLHPCQPYPVWSGPYTPTPSSDTLSRRSGPSWDLPQRWDHSLSGTPNTYSGCTHEKNLSERSGKSSSSGDLFSGCTGIKARSSSSPSVLRLWTF